jgi:hypothetical protein
LEKNLDVLIAIHPSLGIVGNPGQRPLEALSPFWHEPSGDVRNSRDRQKVITNTERQMVDAGFLCGTKAQHQMLALFRLCDRLRGPGYAGKKKTVDIGKQNKIRDGFAT